MSKTREYLIIANTAFAGFIVCIDMYITYISLPAIGKYFSATTSGVSWVSLIYSLVIAGTLLLWGKLSDRIGMSKIFILGYIIFTAGSLLCGFSQSLGFLIFSRFIQGFGGAMLIACAFAIVPKFLPKDTYGMAYGILNIGAGLGVTVGAPLGGIITEYFSWRWIFLINIPFCLAAILLSLNAFKEEVIKKEKEKIDVLGAVLSSIGLILLLYALNMGEEHGWGSIIIISCLLFAVFLLSAFLFWEGKCKAPLIRLNYFKNLNFSFGVLSAFFAFILLSGNNFLLPFYLMYFKGVNPARAGFFMLFISVLSIVYGPISGKLSDSFGPRIWCAFSSFLLMAAFFLFGFSLYAAGFLLTVIFLFMAGTGFGIFVPANNDLVMGLAPHNEEGITAGVYKTITTIGMVLGICLFETLFSHFSHLKGKLIHNLVPSSENYYSALLPGFRAAYLFGGIMGIMGFAFSLFAKTKKAHESRCDSGASE